MKTTQKQLNKEGIMTPIEKIRKIWGEDLFNVFGDYIDDDGWLTSDWHEIIEDEIPQWDKYYRENELYGDTYSRMYNIDYEVNEDETKIRRTDNLLF